MTPLQPDAALGAIVGNKPLPRTKIIKKIWDYIKKNGLQDEQDKRMINVDDKFRPIFGDAEQVHMTKLPGLIGEHIT